MHMLAFTMNYNGMDEIEPLKEGLEEWMSHIEIDKEKYAVDVMPGTYPGPIIGRLRVKYDDKTLFYINFFRLYGRSPEGKKTINGMITVRRRNDAEELTAPGEKLTINVDDHLNANYLDKHGNIAQILQDILPIRDDNEVDKIVKTLDIKPTDIKMDTYNKRYVVDVPIPELKWTQESTPTYFYKYMTLSAFFETMKNKSFRMHSITSQSDTTESFYLGDFMCDEYEDEMKRFKGMLNQKNILISSFTEEYDDAYMWDNYADNGKGVCLGFHMIGENKLRQIQYLDQSKSNLSKYRNAVQKLKEDGIHIHFSAIDDAHRFVKDINYKDEHEWRLIKEFNTDVDFALYKDKIVCYHDFGFDGRFLESLGLQLVSITVGSNQPAGTSNFAFIVEMAHRAFDKDVIINRAC